MTLRSLGDVVEGVTTAASTRPRPRRSRARCGCAGCWPRAARDAIPDAPTQLRAFVAGRAIRLEAGVLDRVRSQVLRSHQRNHAADAALQALAEAAWATHREGERPEFLERFRDHADVERVHGAVVAARWTPARCSLWLADPERVTRYGAGVLSRDEVDVLVASMQTALETGVWSVADVALVDDLAARLGAPREAPREERAFYEIEELDDAGPPRRLRGRPAVRRPAGHRARLRGGPAHPARAVAARTAGGPGGVRPRADRRGPGLLADAVADARPPWPQVVVDGRRRRRAGLVAGRRGGAAGPRGGVRQPAALGCSTWTPTTATPARSSTTRPR